MAIHTRFLSSALLPFAILAVNSTFAAVPVAKNHIAPLIQTEGQDLGQEAPSTILHLTAWLNLHNKAGLDAKVAALYARDSSSYHHWLTPSELKSYGSTEAEIAAVKQELSAHNLSIISIDPWNLSVRFSGKTSDVEAAFNTTIRRVQVRSEVVHTSSNLPALSGAAAGLVSHLAGLGSVSMRSMAQRPVNPHTLKPFAGHVVARDAKPNGVEFSSQCFYAPTTVNVSGLDYDTASISESATYSGLVYGADPANTAKGTLGPCGYSPSELARIYGLAPVYAEGFNGKGQTIVLVDPFLEPYIQADMDTFSSFEGLPDVKINVVNPFNATGSGIEEGWNQEADLDVEMAHAIAPAAGITLLEAATSNTEDLQYTVLYAVQNNLGNVVSNSYGSPESGSSPLDNNVWAEVNELGAAAGISIQYSTGDNGDFTSTGIAADVSSPADTPYGTAVGGTTVALPATGVVTTGWGTNIAPLSYSSNGTLYLYTPTEYQGFSGGSGGGISAYFIRPAYQSGLSGTGRHMPDVSALADPYTGFEFITSTDGVTEEVGVVGGTSVASPLFSALWSLLDEAHGSSLGFAAPLVAENAKTSFITDVLPLTGPANVTATLTTPSGTTTYTAAELASPLYTINQFTTGLLSFGDGQYDVVSFGTDSGLTITPGWDNVTGYGTINGDAFVDAINAVK